MEKQETNPLLASFAQAGDALMKGFTAYLGDIQAGHPLPGMDSEAVTTLQQTFIQKHKALWEQMLSGNGDASTAEPVTDRRFASPEWAVTPHFDYVRRAYLINAEFLRNLADSFNVDDSSQRKRLEFLTRQFIDAMSPANFAATNPEFLNAAIQTRGESISRGLENLLGDLRKGRISLTDEDHFEIGRNVAVSAGEVIFENELIQLIQYAPATDQVSAVPLLIVPPCINKFYILDLQPENSFVRFCVEQGMTVFMVSWRNPGDEQSTMRWDDYLEQGPLTALKIVREICGDAVNTVGWCVGGTILSSALAVVAGRGDPLPNSLTLLTTLLDFSEPGELGNFIDETSVVARETSIGNGGLLKGSELSAVFSSLRANDLVWPYVVNNYYKGKRPEAFDILYWNGDSTNLPGPFLAYYLRNMYLENNLRVPGKLGMCGVSVDLGKVSAPNYVLATREDHIVPWQAAYHTTSLLGGDSTFVLGASGHIAGVINPASRNKRSYWTGSTEAAESDAWMAQASEQKGSWWNHWKEWIAPYRGEMSAAPKQLGNETYKAIEAAPGRYVKQKA